MPYIWDAIKSVWVKVTGKDKKVPTFPSYTPVDQPPDTGTVTPAPAPTFSLSGSSPSTVSSAGGATITVTGVFPSAPSNVTVGGVPVAPVGITGTQFTFSMPAMSPASYDIAVTVNGVTLTLFNAVTVVSSFSLTSATPTNLLTTGGQTVTVTGTGIASPTVTLGGVAMTPQNVTSTGFKFVTPTLTAGNKTLAVTVNGVLINYPVQFSVSAPSSAIVYFSDDFASGDMSKTVVGADATWQWGRNPQGTIWADVVSGFSRRGAVGNCVRLRYNTKIWTIDEESGAAQPSVPAGCAVKYPLRVRVNWWDSGFSGTRFQQSGITVTWSVIAGGGTLAASTSVTDTLGIAVMMYTAGPTAGTNTIRATVSTGQTVDLTFTSVAAVTPGSGAATTLALVSGGVKNNGIPQDKPKNCYWEEPIRVKVTNASGQPLAGVTVAWSVVSGSATIFINSSTTNQQGIAYALPKMGATPGPVTIRASVAGLTGSPVDVTAQNVDSTGTVTTVHAPNEIVAAKANHEGEAQLAIGFGDWTTKMVEEWWVYYPAGGEVIGGVTLNPYYQRGRWRSATFDYLGAANNKFHALYEYYSDAVMRLNQTWTYSQGVTPPDTVLDAVWRPLGSTSYYKTAYNKTPMYSARRGYWHRIQCMHVLESGFGKNDGYCQYRINGVPVKVVTDFGNELRPSDWVGPITGTTFVNLFKYAYYLGYVNSGFSKETHVFLSDFRYSDSFIDDVAASHTFTASSPSTSTTTGGATMTLTGTGFTAEAVVWFVPIGFTGDWVSVPALPSAQTATSLTVTIPALLAGSYDIYVAQAGASVKRAAALTVA